MVDDCRADDCVACDCTDDGCVVDGFAGDGCVGDDCVGDSCVGDDCVGDSCVGDSCADGSCIASLIQCATRCLDAVSDSASLDAQLLLALALGCERDWLWAHGEAVPSEAERNHFLNLVARRQQGEPLAYILGRKHFWKHELLMTPATLIPRPETELLVETALNRFDEAHLRVADLGTGSGAIAISLAAERANWQVLAIDSSADALAVAARNQARHESNIKLVCANWCNGLAPESLDLIVSNPPYIRTDDPHLPVLAFEPRQALVAGATGLESIRKIIPGALPCLAASGWLMLEHGQDQAEAVQTLYDEAGYEDITTIADMNQHPRITLGRKPR